ncbi:hypothetical protein D3C72_1059520 [compost metagenome]
MVGDVGGVAVLVLLPPSRGDDPGLALVPVCLPRVVHLASSCLREGGWRTGASGSDGGFPFFRHPPTSGARSGDPAAPKAIFVRGRGAWSFRPTGAAGSPGLRREDAACRRMTKEKVRPIPSGVVFTAPFGSVRRTRVGMASPRFACLLQHALSARHGEEKSLNIQRVQNSRLT